MEQNHTVVMRDGYVTDLFDFFSSQYSYVLVRDPWLHDLKLVVSISPDYLFSRRILRDIATGMYSLEFLEVVDFDTISDLLDHYSDNFIYEGHTGVIRRLRLFKPCYREVMSLSYLAGVVIKKHAVEVPDEIGMTLQHRALTF